MCDKPLSSENSPFAADHRRGDRLGRRPSRPLGCHAQMIQLPSNALLSELGQASLAVTLVGSLVANRFASQASALNAEVLDWVILVVLVVLTGLLTPGVRAALSHRI